LIANYYQVFGLIASYYKHDTTFFVTSVPQLNIG